MSDIRLRWDLGTADVVITDNDLAVDDGLETAVIASLGSDRLAEAGDVIPDGTTHRRGWWGDAFPIVDGDRLGSRLWLLSREKEQTAVLMRAREYAREALQWLIDDQVADRIDVAAEFTRPGLLGIHVQIHRPAGPPVAIRYPYVWTAQAARDSRES